MWELPIPLPSPLLIGPVSFLILLWQQNSWNDMIYEVSSPGFDPLQEERGLISCTAADPTFLFFIYSCFSLFSSSFPWFTPIADFINCLFLYSFFTTSGAGLEAFFSSTGHLVVAVCNKKEYTSVTVPVCQLCDQTWVRFFNALLLQSRTKRVPKIYQFIG